MKPSVGSLGSTPPHKVDRERIDYSSHVATYDERFRRRAMSYKEMLRRRAVFNAIGDLPRDARVLDVGCGTGRGLSYLLSAGFHHLAGVDYTMGMLEKVGGNLSGHPLNAPVPLINPGSHLR